MVFGAAPKTASIEIAFLNKATNSHRIKLSTGIYVGLSMIIAVAEMQTKMYRDVIATNFD